MSKIYRTTVNNAYLKPNEEACVREMMHLAKNVHNVALYSMNEYYKDTGKSLSKFGLWAYIKEDPSKKLLPSKSAQCAADQAFDEMKSFWAKYKNDKTARPPRYLPKDGETKLVFPKAHICSPINNTVSLTVQKVLKQKYNIIELRVTVPEHIRNKELTLITFLPGRQLKIAFTYEIEQEEIIVDASKFLSIDLGINNFVTAINNVNYQPFIISGKNLKSILYKCNKDVAHYSAIDDKCKKVNGNGRKKNTKRVDKLYEKRNNCVKNELHNISNKVIKYCLNNEIGTIYIGHNKAWKNEAKLGKTTQIFVQMPHSKFIEHLIYKGKEVGIKVIELNEAHTSKCDALALEKICHHDKYLGTRKERGLFVSSTHNLINADVNGAINIARRGTKDDSWMEDFIKARKYYNPIQM